MYGFNRFQSYQSKIHRNYKYAANTRECQFCNLYEKLCANQKCHALENGILYYSDSHHLTIEGALLIMPDLKRIIDPPISK